MCVQVGACIVNGEKKIVGIGYNGMPNGCSDDELPWDREAEDKLNTKYPYGELSFFYLACSSPPPHTHTLYLCSLSC